MNFNDYQRAAMSTAVFPSQYAVLYPALGLAGEAGEVANKVKKIIRGDDWQHDAIAEELGDVLWYCAALASGIGVRLEDVAHANIAKLTDRRHRDVLKGSGDNR